MFKLNHSIRNIFLLLILLVNSAAAYEVLQGPTEVRYWDTARAYNGYTLFGAPGGTYLIDMEGRVIQTWSKVRTNPRFLDNGNILDSSTDDPSRGSGFIEVDWEDNVVWRYTETRSNYAPHHDFVRIFNKKLGAYTTIYIANKSITYEQAIAAGCDPSRNYKDAQMDAIVEVDMDGNVVWEWWFFDHVIQDIDPTKANYVGQGKTIADYPGRININLPGRPLKRDWLHCNSLDYNPQLGHIVTNSVQGEFYVIDHDGTFIPSDPQASIELAAGEAGEFLYRFGDPARYEQGDPPSILEDWTKCTSGHKQIGGAHDVQWIDQGLPGAGHFLIFNNGQYMFERTNQSYIFEINGFLNSNGHDTGDYVNPPDAGYTKVGFHHDTHKPDKLMSNQIVWEYHSKSNQGFFSHIGAGAQRLPNGNTLICSDTEGHFFEVTSDAEVVWEYINPMTREYGAVTVMPDSLPMTNSVFRAYRYGAGHPTLVGRDLTPGDTLTGKEPNYDTPEIEKNMSLHLPKSLSYLITLVAIMGLSEQTFDVPEIRIIPSGTFDMGDHHDLGGAEHRNDEVPIHLVTLDSFYIGVYEITNQQYCEYLNDVLIQGLVNVEDGYVISTQTGDLLCDTYQSDGYSRIHSGGNGFSVSETMADHPVVGIRWAGAVAYCNWLSSVMDYQPCYDPNTGLCDFTKDGFRLPTEAEWEYAGRGGLHNPYAIYPWGDDPDNTKANWPNSGDPYEAGSMPYTSPVGFYNGQEHLKTDFRWPGSASSYRTMDGSNGYGLYDMAGNVWEWTNDWYHGDYYSVSPRYNPLGPTTGKPMPDGNIYHVLRSGNWYNGPQGHSRVSNRNPAHFRGPQDPYHPWYHIGFRIARNNTSDTGLTPEKVTLPGAQATIIADGFDFAEGPAANSMGELFFSECMDRGVFDWFNQQC